MTLPALPLSFLELSPVGEGRTAEEAVASMLDLAREVEGLGFTRFWLAEHHGMPGIASSAPSVLIGAVAGATRRIRVGSGGVMLPNHPPLVVAEQFGTLAALHPGRIDLGLGRAPGTDPTTAAALRRSVDPLSADDFPQQLMDLVAYLDGASIGTVRAVPSASERPPVWLLGSSGYSAQLAGMLGLPFAFAHHFSPDNTLPALELYRRHFAPSDVLDAPYAMVAAQVLCGETDEQAELLAQPSLLSWVRLRQGRPGPLPSPQTCAAHDWSDLERAIVAERVRGQALGGPERVAAQLSALLDATQADELMITTTAYEPTDRISSVRRTRALFGEAPLPDGLAASRTTAPA
ncbi:MAG TPA: LLM class flavin-dependent oxidoreductase [Candidatus Nanopelagicales bacterium]|nr:LLM class flavin-dependent oxidoreductase [Candidatus Nanopelagicales bacterium]